MGFEYKIKTNLSEKIKTEIQCLLENNKMFDKKYEFEGKMFWDFRQTDNNGVMPNMSITFENDGIYICQNSSSYLWVDLEALKHYFDIENIKYEIVDYQD